MPVASRLTTRNAGAAFAGDANVLVGHLAADAAMAGDERAATTKTTGMPANDFLRPIGHLHALREFPS